MPNEPSLVPGRRSDARKKPVIEAAERRTPTGTVEVEDWSPVSQEWETRLNQYRVQFLVLDRHDDPELAIHFRAQPGWRVPKRRPSRRSALLRRPIRLYPFL